MVDFNDVGGIAVSGMDIILDIVLYVFIGLFICGVLFFVILMTKYDKRVIIRKKINGKNKIFYDKAKKLERDGVVWWRLLKGKKNIEVPPNEAIEVDKRGRDFVELYELETGEYIPILDKNDKIESLEPFTTNQRQLLQGQYTKANLERGFKLSDHIATISYIAALVILVICLMVFYGDIAKPVLEMGDKQAGIAAQQIEMQKEMNKMLDKITELHDAVIASNMPDDITQPRTNINLSSRGVPN